MRRLVPAAIFSLTCFTALAGCDTEEYMLEAAKADPVADLPPPEGEEEPAKAEAPAMEANDAQKLPSPEGAYPNDASSRAACLAKCAEGNRSDEDQATCRLNCGHEASPEQAAVRQYVDCHRGCGDTGDDCESKCRGSLFSTLTNQSALDPKCSAPCFDTLNACESKCAEGEGGDDAKATCALHCESEGARCLGACSPAAKSAAP